MNILWITNTVFPAPGKSLRLQSLVVGGWLCGLASRLAAQTFADGGIRQTFARPGIPGQYAYKDAIQYD